MYPKRAGQGFDMLHAAMLLAYMMTYMLGLAAMIKITAVFNGRLHCGA